MSAGTVSQENMVPAGSRPARMRKEGQLARQRDYGYRVECADLGKSSAAQRAGVSTRPGLRVYERGGDAQHGVLQNQVSFSFFSNSCNLLPDFCKFR